MLALRGNHLPAAGAAVPHDAEGIHPGDFALDLYVRGPEVGKRVEGGVLVLGVLVEEPATRATVAVGYPERLAIDCDLTLPAMALRVTNHKQAAHGSRAGSRCTGDEQSAELP